MIPQDSAPCYHSTMRHPKLRYWIVSATLVCFNVGPMIALTVTFPAIPVWTTDRGVWTWEDRKSTRLNSSHTVISYAVFCLKKKKQRKTGRGKIQWVIKPDPRE